MQGIKFNNGDLTIYAKKKKIVLAPKLKRYDFYSHPAQRFYMIMITIVSGFMFLHIIFTEYNAVL